MNLNDTRSAGPLTADDFDAAIEREIPPARYSATRWPPCDITPRCSGPCEQGDKPCQTPDACYQPEACEPPATRGGLALILMSAAVSLALIGAAVRGCSQ